MSVQLEALDILGDLLSRFGGKLISREGERDDGNVTEWRLHI